MHLLPILIVSALLSGSALGQNSMSAADRLELSARVCDFYRYPAASARHGQCLATVGPVMHLINFSRGSLDQLTRTCRDVFAARWRDCLDDFNRVQR